MKKGEKEALLTQSLVPGETVYGEKKVTTEVSFFSFVKHE